jgi:biotin carboxylase
MSKTHVLLINSGKAEAADQLLTAAADVELDILTEPAYAPMYRAGTRLNFVDDIGDMTAVRRAALDLLAEHPIHHIVAPSERSLQAGGYLRSFLGLPGLTFEVANRFSNKAVMKARLAEHGLPLAPYRVVGRAAGIPAEAAELGWPVVIKPALGTGSMNVFVARGPDDLADLLASPLTEHLRNADCPLLVEAFVEMEAEYHSDGVVDGGVLRFASVSRYLTTQLDTVGGFNGSYVLPDSSPDVGAIRELHTAAVAALSLPAGVTHLEVYKTAGGFVVGEISCRPAGGGITDAVQEQYGIDLWRIFMESALNREISLPTPLRAARDEVVAVSLLPARPGRVVRISTADELARIPDVLRVEMSATVGTVIGHRLHSASASGQVLIAAADEETVRKRVDELMQTFVLDVRPA